MFIVLKSILWNIVGHQQNEMIQMMEMRLEAEDEKLQTTDNHQYTSRKNKGNGKLNIIVCVLCMNDTCIILVWLIMQLNLQGIFSNHFLFFSSVLSCDLS